MTKHCQGETKLTTLGGMSFQRACRGNHQRQKNIGEGLPIIFCLCKEKRNKRQWVMGKTIYQQEYISNTSLK